MDDLRETHLGPHARRQPAPDGPTVAEQMQAVYAAVLKDASSQAAAERPLTAPEH